MSSIISYAPTTQSTSLVDGIYRIAGNLEIWQADLDAEVNKFLHRDLAD